jgi:hypothetical protein
MVRRPNRTSNYGGVQIGVITYSFRQGVTAKDLVPAITKLGISSVELMSNHAEALAGAPSPPAFGGGGPDLQILCCNLNVLQSERAAI